MSALLTNTQLLITVLLGLCTVLGIVYRSPIGKAISKIGSTVSDSETQAARKELDVSQQATLDNYKETLEAVKLRVRVLEDTNREREAGHQVELVRLRGDFADQLARSQEVAMSLTTRISEQDIIINDLRNQLREATEALAAAARQMLRSGDREDRSERKSDKDRL